MKIVDVICSAGRTGFYFDDQRAIKGGAGHDGVFYVGQPVTEGFTAVRQAGESISVMLLLEDGQIRDFNCGYAKYRSILEREAMAKPVVAAAPKPKKEKPKGGTKDSEKLIRRLERDIEKQEKLVAELDSKIEAAVADYQELTRLLGEKEEAELVLMDLMEQWEAAQE